MHLTKVILISSTLIGAVPSPTQFNDLWWVEASINLGFAIGDCLVMMFQSFPL